MLAYKRGDKAASERFGGYDRPTKGESGNFPLMTLHTTRIPCTKEWRVHVPRRHSAIKCVLHSLSLQCSQRSSSRSMWCPTVIRKFWLVSKKREGSEKPLGSGVAVRLHRGLTYQRELLLTWKVKGGTISCLVASCTYGIRTSWKTSED